MVWTKICGLTRPADVEAVARAGADAVGFNFYPQSPRYLPPDHAGELVAALGSLTGVALFVEKPIAHCVEVAYQLGLGTIQWVGERPVATSPLAKWIVSFRIRTADDLIAVGEYVADNPSATILIDAHADGAFGGTGRLAPWELLDGFDPGVPWILAGGLTSENVGDAVRRLRPWGVDVAGGVELAPGIKDQDKVRRFVDAAKSAW